jgi:hypothetical protein
LDLGDEGIPGPEAPRTFSRAASPNDGGTAQEPPRQPVPGRLLWLVLALSAVTWLGFAHWLLGCGCFLGHCRPSSRRLDPTSAALPPGPKAVLMPGRLVPGYPFVSGPFGWRRTLGRANQAGAQDRPNVLPSSGYGSSRSPGAYRGYLPPGPFEHGPHSGSRGWRGIRGATPRALSRQGTARGNATVGAVPRRAEGVRVHPGAFCDARRPLPGARITHREPPIGRD